MRDAFARTLYAVAKQEPKVFVVAADISPAGSMAAFRNEFPEQFINVGVAEQSMIGLAAGLALRGWRPFAYTIATFAIYRTFEFVRDDLCYQNLPVTVVGVGGGVTYAFLGGTHHAQEDIAVMGSLPNMSIIAPCDPLEVEAATWACARHSGPVYLRLGKAGEPTLTADAAEPFAFGKLRLVKPGSELCLITYGPIMKMVSELAARIEREQGRSVAVVSAHTLKPLDRDRIAQLLKTFETVAVIEEHSERGGLGAQVKQIAWEEGATCGLHTFGLKDAFLHVYGAQTDLWRAHGIDAERILQMLSERKRHAVH